jgi:hypothetical protein
MAKQLGDGSSFAHVLAVVITVVGITIPAFAANGATKITVAQLEQILSGLHGKQDAEIVAELSDLELTERLSTRTLTRLKANVPGAQSSQELDLLANQSAFLPLPAVEIPSTPAPDGNLQRQIVTQAVKYVTQTIHQMPNFLAERETGVS